MGLQEYVTVDDAAKILGVTAGRVHQIVRSGHLPAKRIGPRMLLLPRAVVEWYAALPKIRGGPKPRIAYAAAPHKKNRT